MTKLLKKYDHTNNEAEMKRQVFLLMVGAQIAMNLGTMVFDWDFLFRQDQYNIPFKIHDNYLCEDEIFLLFSNRMIIYCVFV